MECVSKRAEVLLSEILEHRDEKGNCDTNYWKERFEDLSAAEDAILRSLFKELRENELIYTGWADDYPYILLLLAKGLSYFEEKEMLERDKGGSYTNNFYASVNGVQIQQGTRDSRQEQKITQPLDAERINELIQKIRNYDAILKEEYGVEGADKLRKATNDLERSIKDCNDTERTRNILEYIRNVSANAAGGLIATGIVQLISTIVG